jgi:hypothetical protein
LISDTGIRLAKACGVLNSDIKMDTDIPRIGLSGHLWRRLKTKSNVHQIPLVGASLWVAKKIHIQETQFAFPKYCGGINDFLSQKMV